MGWNPEGNPWVPGCVDLTKESWSKLSWESVLTRADRTLTDSRLPFGYMASSTHRTETRGLWPEINWCQHTLSELPKENKINYFFIKLDCLRRVVSNENRLTCRLPIICLYVPLGSGRASRLVLGVQKRVFLHQFSHSGWRQWKADKGLSEDTQGPGIFSRSQLDLLFWLLFSHVDLIFCSEQACWCLLNEIVEPHRKCHLIDPCTLISHNI